MNTSDKLSVQKRGILSLRTFFIAIILIFMIFGLVHWYVMQPVRSVQAFVNTNVFVVRAPISGRLDLRTATGVGTAVHAGEVLGVITGEVENPIIATLRIQLEQETARVGLLEEQIKGYDRRLLDRRLVAGQFAEESEHEHRLRKVFLAAQIAAAREDLHRSTATATVLAANEHRQRSLNAAGAASQAILESAVGSNEAAEADIGLQKARIAQLEAAQDAAGYGFDLDGLRTLSQPTSRLRELRSATVDMEQAQLELRQSLAAERAVLAVIESELARVQKTTLLAPNSAVIWSAETLNGESVTSGNPILHLAACDVVWIEAFFDESATATLMIGMPVMVRLLHGKKSWRGHIETIRAGSGRVTVGDTLPPPPPEIARRQLPVRVVTVRVHVDWAATDLDPKQFCLAGRSVEVSIE